MLETDVAAIPVVVAALISLYFKLFAKYTNKHQLPDIFNISKHKDIHSLLHDGLNFPY